MKVVTSIYELQRDCGKGHYKAFEASYMRAVKALPKGEWIKYVVYTDRGTYENYKNDFISLLAQSVNLEIKFFEWKDSEFHTGLKPLIHQARSMNDCDSIYDKHIIVDGYCELVCNKFRFVLDNITDEDETIYWLDGGLFLGSCNFPWRDWITYNCNTKYFFDTLNEFAKNDFFMVQSEYMPHPIHYRDILNEAMPEGTGQNLVVAGGIWGGDCKKVKIICEEMIANGHDLVNRNLIVSDQELMVMSVMKEKERFKLVRFGDWYDYQRVFLTIMNVYNPETYTKDLCNIPNIEL